MKIRALLLTLVCALATGSGFCADEPETELGGKMEKIGGAFRALRRQVSDATKNADSLTRVATIRQNAEAAIKLEPAMKRTGGGNEFVENYRRHEPSISAAKRGGAGNDNVEAASSAVWATRTGGHKAQRRQKKK